jgi:serine acetyltransferase
VLAGTLADAQKSAIEAAGARLGDDDPSVARLVVGDGTFVTRGLVRGLLGAGRPGRLAVRHAGWLQLTGPLLADPAHPFVGVVPAGSPAGPDCLDGLDEIEVDPLCEESPPLVDHPAFGHLADDGPLLSGLAFAHDVEHWVHLLRLNALALSARGREAVSAFKEGNPLSRIGSALAVLWRAGWPTEARVLRAVSRIHPTAKVHPSAIVEACELGPQVNVGPGAILRGCVVGGGANIEAQVYAAASSIGPRATLSRGAHVVLCVLAERAWVSPGFGHQMCLFGRESFLAIGVTTIDLSFGAPVIVDVGDERRSAGTHFCGSCIGHRARIGAGARLGYGMAVPNDAFLVAPTDDLLRRWPPTTGVGGPVTTIDGAARPLQRRAEGS